MSFRESPTIMLYAGASPAQDAEAAYFGLKGFTSPTDSPLYTPTQQEWDDGFGDGGTPGPVPRLASGVYLAGRFTISGAGDQSGRSFNYNPTTGGHVMGNENGSLFAWLYVPTEDWLGITLDYSATVVGRTVSAGLALVRVGDA